MSEVPNLRHRLLTEVAALGEGDRILEPALLREIVRGVSLPLIIRQSTQGITSEAVRGVRMQADGKTMDFQVGPRTYAAHPNIADLIRRNVDADNLQLL